MSSPFVNRHVTRALAGGADASTIDVSWLNTVDAWLTPDDDLRHWVNPAFGTVKNGSNVISKIFDLGATRLPWGGDLTMATANTTYVTGGSGIGGLPAWSNAAGAYAYFGAARAGTIRHNNIRRLHYRGCTMVAVYKKSVTTQVTPLSIGQFGGLALQNTSGSPGNARFFTGGYGNAWTATDTSTGTIANNAVNIIGGTFDGPTLAVKVYVEGVAAGSGATATDSGPLIGGVITANGNYLLVSGSSSAKLNPTTHSPDDPAPTFSNSEAQMTLSDLIVLGSALSPSRMASLNALLRNRIGP